MPVSARLGELLVAAKVATVEDIDAALERQLAQGGRLGDNLIELGVIDRARLESFLRRLPPEPATIADTGIPDADLVDLLMKNIYVSRIETVDQFADSIKLPHHIVADLTRALVVRHRLAAAEAQGPLDPATIRYHLTDEGNHYATEALKKCRYTGPAPVSLDAFVDRIQRQKVTNELVEMESVLAAFDDLIVADSFIERLGPALNSGRSILLYGPPGNGKTSVALRLQLVFSDVIYVPYAVMIEGQIMRVYDPRFHGLTPPALKRRPANPAAPAREPHDARWAPSRRPFIVTGGELTLDQLELAFDPATNVYEAPLQVKAQGGCFIIDDFGRQQASPVELLKRWLVPLEGKVDYLKLQGGKSFAMPFEALIIFSTNIPPEELMDPAILRRIPYKLKLGEPSPQQFCQILAKAAASANLELTDELVEAVLQRIGESKGTALAAYQPRFIVDQVLSACRFSRQPPHLEPRFIDYAIDNLRVV
jgi:hypothetical protein